MNVNENSEINAGEQHRLEDLTIRSIRKDDLPALHEIVNMPDVAELLGMHAWIKFVGFNIIHNIDSLPKATKIMHGSGLNRKRNMHVCCAQ